MGEALPPSEFFKWLTAVDEAASVDGVVKVYERFIAAYGFRSIALGYLVQPDNPNTDFQVHTWPAEWYEQWHTRDLIIHDPIARYALKAKRPFTWNTAYDHATRFGKTILDESRNFGFAEGLAIPIPALEGPAGCVSIGTDRLELSPEDRRLIELVTYHVYARLEEFFGGATSPVRCELSPRETDVVQLGASGRSNKEIA